MAQLLDIAEPYTRKLGYRHEDNDIFLCILAHTDPVLNHASKQPAVAFHAEKRSGARDRDSTRLWAFVATDGGSDLFTQKSSIQGSAYN